MKLIDADKYFNLIVNAKSAMQCIEKLHSMPTVDAVPVVHGKWVKKEKIFEDGTTYGCSNCGGTPLRRYNARIMSDYCPWCGAKMDESTQFNNSNTLDALGEKVTE